MTILKGYIVYSSYEVWPVLNAGVAMDGGYLMVDKAVELLEELHGEAFENFCKDVIQCEK